MLVLNTVTTALLAHVGMAGSLPFAKEGILVSFLILIALAGAAMSSVALIAVSTLGWRRERIAAKSPDQGSCDSTFSLSERSIFAFLGVGGYMVAVTASLPAYLLTVV